MPKRSHRRAPAAADARRVFCALLFFSLIFCWVLCLTMLGAAPALGQEAAPFLLPDALLPSWDISGSNTLRLERYRVKGDKAASPYAFEGPQSYNDLSFSFAKRESAFESWRGQFAGVVNRSDYRATDENLIVERMNLTWEKGDAAVPYRLEGGDSFAFFSQRTLQKSLKGLQLEFQPGFSAGGESHSFVLASGFSDSDYRDVDPARDNYNGASWLIEHPALGRLSLNGVYNFREADIAAASPERRQSVFSVAAEHEQPMAGRKLNFEVEAAYFRGDFGAGSTTSEGKSEAAYVAQVGDEGSGTPLSYSLRFERVGKNFQPNGGAVTPNRRTWELRSGWLFPNDMRLAGRLQKFTDGLEETGSTTTETAGFDFNGPAPFAGASFNVGGFVQDQTSRDKTTHNLTRSFTTDLGFPLPGGWAVGGNLNIVQTNDLNSEADTVTRQLSLRAGRSISLFGLSGSVSPGLTLQNATSATRNFAVIPSVALNLTGGPHTLSADYRFDARRVQNSADTDTQSASLAYGFRSGPHELGLEFSMESRAPDSADHTQSYKVAAFWRVNFGKPARVEPTPAEVAPLPATAAPSSIANFRLTALAPGMPLALARERLGDAGIAGGVALPGAVVYEIRILPGIDRRQRLALVHDRGRLTKVALIVDLDATGGVEDAARTFDRVREVLIRRYGSPVSTFEQGQFTANLAADVSAGRLIRTTEWRTIAGTIRLGIPRRLDRRARIEIQIAPAFAPPRQTLWSVETVQ